jgi:phosphoribosylaminoimidazolecarboxamide formyltransferase/IMP cyclohydrolase
MKRALLSVSDKTGIVDFARALADRGWDLVSTGGTAQSLRDAGLAVKDVAEITGHPEMMEGRVKTLHPAVHAGILARRDRPDDLAAMAEQGYGPIDLVAVNLYPFRETIAKGGVGVKEAMSKVDIGGPTMIRAAAKNHEGVWVVVDPADYAGVLAAVDWEGVEGGAEDAPALRRTLAAKVFRHISAYDAAVAAYLEEGTGADPLPEDLPLGLHRLQTLRYGENPDQAASFYGFGTPTGVAGLKQLHGKELSYNNILDLDGALLCLSPFAFSPRPAAVIVKHTTPCGLAVGDSLAEAYAKALRCDPVSAFGSVIAVNRTVDSETAALMGDLFIECIVAPAFSDEAMALLTTKKNVRLMAFPAVESALPFEPSEGWWRTATPELKGTARFVAAHGRFPHERVLRSVYGGMLAQTPPLPPFYGVDDPSWKVVTRREPSPAAWDDLRFAWAAVFGAKSNAILLAGDGATLGIGAGQTSRVDAARIAGRKAFDAKLDLSASVLASDAFFPFRDGVDAAARVGVQAIVQPGGSVRDEETIAAADEHGIAMVFTGRRLFRH